MHGGTARSGRPGTALIPDGWTTLRVCPAWNVTADGGGSGTSAVGGADDGRGVDAAATQRAAAQLNALSTKRSTASCAVRVEAPTAQAQVVLWFDYPTGRSVFVALTPGCTPPVDNSYLAADATYQQVTGLLHTLQPR